MIGGLLLIMQRTVCSIVVNNACQYQSVLSSDMRVIQASNEGKSGWSQKRSMRNYVQIREEDRRFSKSLFCSELNSDAMFHRAKYPVSLKDTIQAGAKLMSNCTHFPDGFSVKAE